MKNKNAGLLVLRIGLGILFLIAGFGKMTGIAGLGIDGFSGMVFGSVLLAWIIALGEFLGGISLLVGVWTRYSTIGLSVIMLGALFMVSIPGFDASAPMTVIELFLNLNVLTALIGVTLIGTGTCSIKPE